MRPPGPNMGGPGPNLGGPGPNMGGPGPNMGGPGQNMGGPGSTASNITNDPKGAHCRLFVGNLNTIALKKEDVENIFRR